MQNWYLMSGNILLTYEVSNQAASNIRRNVGRNDKFAYNICTHHEEDTHTTADTSLKIHTTKQPHNQCDGKWITLLLMYSTPSCIGWGVQHILFLRS